MTRAEKLIRAIKVIGLREPRKYRKLLLDPHKWNFPDAICSQLLELAMRVRFACLGQKRVNKQQASLLPMSVLREE